MREYVHGYTPEEAGRLRNQRQVLEPLLHPRGGARYPAGARVLEAGCGVGAQTVILAQANPGARIISIDRSPDSLARAREAVESRGLGNVEFREADLMRLPFADAQFDAAFVCFVLEHLREPLAALRELRRVLRPGGALEVIEGDHGSWLLSPETAEARHAWNCLIECQKRLGGDSLIGRRLYPLLTEAGFERAEVEPLCVYGDAGRRAMRNGFLELVIAPMVETARRQSLEEGLADSQTWEAGLASMRRNLEDPRCALFYTFFRGRACAPA